MYSTVTYKIFQTDSSPAGTRYLIQDSDDNFYYGRMTKFTGNLQDPNVYVKRPCILAKSPGYGTFPSVWAQLTERKISVGEVLARNPHPNVCQYLGVVTAPPPVSARITDIAYKRYSCDLQDFFNSGYLRSPAQVWIIMQGLRAGLDHMHKLGFVHCDLNPTNVFLRTWTAPETRSSPPNSVIFEAAIGDFDTVTRVGKVIEFKRAPDDWWPYELGIDFDDPAAVEIDDACVKKTEEWLKSKIDHAD
ncbi:hypothetical protein CC80DRAFT_580866 [Byssothecium circinans]|uniref:Protein kinase domain-containing protein n=1 Tax=Byssothecium circinans TaxID=147558 RepID=A0A6A5U9E6_9PLEO|nr:hypothetical protein CC80DRAFT_580866 [Byssothecium circinans]